MSTCDGTNIEFELESPPRCYTIAEATNLVKMHVGLVQDFGLQHSYVDHTAPCDALRTEPLLDSANYLGVQGLSIRIGPLASFSLGEMAVVIHEQTKAYLRQGTLGAFPSGDAGAARRLMADMIDGFSESEVWISLRCADVDGFVPLAGGRVVRGTTGRLLHEVNGCSSCTLPTLAALMINSDRLVGHESGLAYFPEEDVVCISRLFSQHDCDRGLLGVPRSAQAVLALHVMAYCIQACVAQARRENRPDPLYGIFDTHLPKLVQISGVLFGTSLLACGPDVNPTSQVLNSGHGFHYSTYRGQIHVVGGYTGQGLAGTERVLRSCPWVHGSATGGNPFLDRC